MKLLLTIAEICCALSLSRSKVYDLINEGKLERVKIGRAARVTGESLDALLASLGPPDDKGDG